MKALIADCRSELIATSTSVLASAIRKAELRVKAIEADLSGLPE